MLKIVLLCLFAAITYGILQDQITARVCVEYFTIGHPPVFQSDDPTTLAFGWGVLATWWVGLLLGVPLALVARIGSRPRLDARDLVKPVAVLMFCVGITALIAGLAGYLAAENGLVWMVGPLKWRVPPEKHTRFLADAWAHVAAYASGFVGGIVVWVRTWKRRGVLVKNVEGRN